LQLIQLVVVTAETLLLLLKMFAVKFRRSLEVLRLHD